MSRKSKELKKVIEESSSESEEEEAEEAYVVERVLDRRLLTSIKNNFAFVYQYHSFNLYCRINDDRVEYLLKWKGVDDKGRPW